MDFYFFDSICPGFSLDLEVLREDSNLYAVLLYQHQGAFCATPNKFGNVEDVSHQFNKYIELAKSENVALAITPEYSCPWSSIISILDTSDLQPDEGKLWAFGCESIQPDELLAIRNSYQRNEHIFIYFDEATFNSGGVLLDPLCYVFKSRDDSGTIKLILLVQFKTHHMGVWESATERERYIRGNEIYILRNDPTSVYLFTLICSDAADFDLDDNFKTQNRWDRSFIILSLQLNPKPCDLIFRNLRNNIFTESKKDLITLNWGGSTIVGGGNIGFSRSGFHFRANDAHIGFRDEQKFINNHDRGFYYVFRKPEIHNFYLHPNGIVFLITNQKPHVGTVMNSMNRKNGPLVSKNFDWNETNQDFEEIETLNDGFIQFLDDLSCADRTCRDENLSFIDKERMISICMGKIKASTDVLWHRLDRVPTFQINDSELIRRFTLVHDEDTVAIRADYIKVIETLNQEILSNVNYYPSNLRAFKNNCTRVNFLDKEYDYNLISNDQKHKATVAYLNRTTKGKALEALNSLQRIFKIDDQSRKRVVIWYHKNLNEIAFECDSMPTVNDDTTSDPNSITNE